MFVEAGKLHTGDLTHLIGRLRRQEKADYLIQIDWMGQHGTICLAGGKIRTCKFGQLADRLAVSAISRLAGCDYRVTKIHLGLSNGFGILKSAKRSDGRLRLAGSELWDTIH